MGIFKFITQEQVLGIVRHGLTTLAGLAIAKGYLDSENAVQITGWVLSGIGILWSVISKRGNI